ncbi:hypothetical protein ACHAXT_013116 [Thalassiosira profunda]
MDSQRPTRPCQRAYGSYCCERRTNMTRAAAGSGSGRQIRLPIGVVAIAKRVGAGACRPSHIILDAASRSSPPAGPPSRLFSSAPSFGDSYHYDEAAFEPPPPSLKKVVRPFLRACHPDATSVGDAADNQGHPLSEKARATNLDAVQTINGLIDAVEEIVGRCTPPAYADYSSIKRPEGRASAGTLPELKARYEIEFILPTGANVEDSPVKRKHKRGSKKSLTLRAITVEFPEEMREDARRWALTPFADPSSMHESGEYETTPSEEEAFRTAMQLQEHAVSEFLRLLTVAGMQAPSSTEGETQEQPRQQGRQFKEVEQWTLSDHFLHELGVHPEEDPSESRNTAFYGRTQSRPGRAAPPAYSHVQRERQQFMDSIPWNKFSEDYDDAYADAQADWTTSALDLYNINTSEGRERRERFVSQICGSVRIWRASTDGAIDGVDELDEIPEGLDVVAQLIAIRRLSLLLYDNFDRLRMEKMGRMWERLVIVLTPPRGLTKERRRQALLEDGVDDDASSVHRRKKLNKWERRLRRRERLKPVSRGQMRHTAETMLHPKEDDVEAESSEETGDEEEPPFATDSGFKFSYGTTSDQRSGRVTAYIPIDFRDGELVRQLFTFCYDYFDHLNAGFLQYGADGKVRANVMGADERTSKSEGGQKSEEG